MGFGFAFQLNISATGSDETKNEAKTMPERGQKIASETPQL